MPASKREQKREKGSFKKYAKKEVTIFEGGRTFKIKSRRPVKGFHNGKSPGFSEIGRPRLPGIGLLVPGDQKKLFCSQNK